MSPAQADDSYDAIVKGWQCQETDRGVPFYIHNSDGATDWDHPYYTKVMEELDAYQDVHFAAYRTALKLRHLQKKFGLHLLSLQCLQSVMHDHGFPSGCTGTVDSQALQLILLDIFHTPDYRHFDTFRQDVASELLHNYLMNLFDLSRTGTVKVLSVKLALAALCNGSLSEKYHYFFQEIKSSQTFVSRDGLSAFIADLVQIADLLRESVAFGKNIAAAVDSCVQVAGTLGDGVPEKGFYTWLMREPQTLIWLPTLHRLIAAQTVKHDCKCSICKATPMVGFRYKCLQCFKFNMCQDCFFHGRVAKNHQLKHPIQEYCLPVTAKDETKVFLKVVRNKMSGRNRRPGKVAFLPVDNTADKGLTEWEMRSTPAPPSPPSASREEDVGLGSADGEVASDDSGHSSDQGGEGASQRSQTLPSPSHGSMYDNSNSPARYLEERQPKKAQSLLQDRHSLIHLVHRLRRENRLLRQQLRGRSCSLESDREMWRSCATAEVISEGSLESQSVSPDVSGHGSPDMTHPTFDKSGTELSRTISPIGEMTNTTADHQAYTSDFFNSILGTTTTTTAVADVTAPGAGMKSTSEVFASTPAVSTASVLKSGQHKPPRLLAEINSKNTVSISYIHPERSIMMAQSETPTATKVQHKVQVHAGSPPSQTEAEDTLDWAEGSRLGSVGDNKVAVSTPPPLRHNVSVDEIWADDTPCTIRKKISKPTRLNSGRKSVNFSFDTPETPDMKCRRKSTGSLKDADTFEVSGVETLDTPETLKRHSWMNRLGFQTPGTETLKRHSSMNRLGFQTPGAETLKRHSSMNRLGFQTPGAETLKRHSSMNRLGFQTPGAETLKRHSSMNRLGFQTPGAETLKRHSSMNRLGFQTPGADKSLFAVSRGDSVLKSPERQEIDEMIQWIDDAFPPDLSYSALSLCPDESTTQKRMLQAAEGIGQAMADLVQATADNCYM